MLLIPLQLKRFFCVLVFNNSGTKSKLVVIIFFLKVFSSTYLKNIYSRTINKLLFLMNGNFSKNSVVKVVLFNIALLLRRPIV